MKLNQEIGVISTSSLTDYLTSSSSSFGVWTAHFERTLFSHVKVKLG